MASYGFIVFAERGDLTSVDWRIAGAALPTGAVPLYAERDGVAVELHGYPCDSDVVRAIARAAEEARG